MSQDRITLADLQRALEAHRVALERAGIVYDGRLGLDEGSKLYGRAFRLFVTDRMDRCQYRADATMGRSWHEWDHQGCPVCHGTKQARCTGHYRPPVGDDFLGMTNREAFETLTARTRAIYDTVGAMVKP